MGLGKTLSEIEHVGPDEMAGWMAFWQLEPWGCPAEDHRAELGLNLLYAVNSKSNAKIPLFIDRDPEGRVKIDPTPEQLDDNIMDFFLGKTIKVEAVAEVPALPAPAKKTRKTRKDKGVKRGPRISASKITPPAK